MDTNINIDKKDDLYLLFDRNHKTWRSVKPIAILEKGTTIKHSINTSIEGANVKDSLPIKKIGKNLYLQTAFSNVRHMLGVPTLIPLEVEATQAAPRGMSMKQWIIVLSGLGVAGLAFGGTFLGVKLGKKKKQVPVRGETSTSDDEPDDTAHTESSASGLQSSKHTELEEEDESEDESEDDTYDHSNLL
jgi:hypothetical protein